MQTFLLKQAWRLETSNLITPPSPQDLDRDGGDALHNAFQMQGDVDLSIAELSSR